MALYEYRAPSYEYVLEMSWCEFLIRQYAYNREQRRQWTHTREVSYASLIGPHLDPKTIPSKENFINLNEPSKKQGLTDIQVEAILKAKAEYRKQVQQNERKSRN